MCSGMCTQVLILLYVHHCTCKWFDCTSLGTCTLVSVLYIYSWTPWMYFSCTITQYIYYHTRNLVTELRCLYICTVLLFTFITVPVLLYQWLGKGLLYPYFFLYMYWRLNLILKKKICAHFMLFRVLRAFYKNSARIPKIFAYILRVKSLAYILRAATFAYIFRA